MLKIYTTPSCSSCKKVKQWLEEQGIPYVEKNIFASALNEKELTEILSLTENGTDDIISKRSRIIRENNIDIDSMSIKELIEFIKANPSVLKRPIILDDKKFQVGYNPDEITVFLSRAKRIALWECQRGQCGECDQCPIGLTDEDLKRSD
ncbi:MAG: Spx/MgsR family RNA polymerase-binding regulatory protein [Coprobacillus sp.]|nr:Spx/MgsR family RNA polymerase-binding regulatory protein [Coprobacillus sp.]